VGEAADAEAASGLEGLGAEAAGDDHAAGAEAAGLGKLQRGMELGDHVDADGVAVVLAFDEVGVVLEPLAQGGDEVDAHAVEALFGLDAVAEHAQQGGGGVLEALALLGGGAAAELSGLLMRSRSAGWSWLPGAVRRRSVAGGG
jgi:hypothetical protein